MQKKIEKPEWLRVAEEFEASGLTERMTSLEAKMAALERRVFGKKAERLAPVTTELRAGAASPEAKAQRDEAALKKRRERAARKAQGASTREVHHAVPDAQRHCPSCGSEGLKALGEGRTTVVYEYVPARFERQVHGNSSPEPVVTVCG